MSATATAEAAPVQIAPHASEDIDLYRAPTWIRQDRAARLVGISERTLNRWITLGYVTASYPGGAGVVVDKGKRAGRRRRAPGVVLVQRDSLIAYIESCVAQPKTDARRAKASTSTARPAK